MLKEGERCCCYYYFKKNKIHKEIQKSIEDNIPKEKKFD